MSAQLSPPPDIAVPDSPAHPRPDPRARGAHGGLDRAGPARHPLLPGSRPRPARRPARRCATPWRGCRCSPRRTCAPRCPSSGCRRVATRKAELASGALELVETSGSTGERLRILWDEGWWLRQETRAMRTNAARRGAPWTAPAAPYREAILTTPECGLGTCHIGDLPYEERSDETLPLAQPAPGPPLLDRRRADAHARRARAARHRGARERPVLPGACSALRHAPTAATLDVRGFVQLTYAFTTRALPARHPRGLRGRRRSSSTGRARWACSSWRATTAGSTTRRSRRTWSSCPRACPTPGAKDVALVVVDDARPASRMPLCASSWATSCRSTAAGPRAWTTVPAAR